MNAYDEGHLFEGDTLCCCDCGYPTASEYWRECVDCDRPVCVDCGWHVGTEIECEECFSKKGEDE
jgi:hypothetical protein